VTHLPLLSVEQAAHWPDVPIRSTLAGIAHFTWPRSHSRTSMSMICRALSSQNNWPSVFSW